jgi:hypothetical protein
VKLVLDTNIYCDYAEGLPHVVDFLAAYGEDIFLPSIVLGELTYGFMKGSRLQFNERKLQEIIKKLKIEIIEVDHNVSSCNSTKENFKKSSRNLRSKLLRSITTSPENMPLFIYLLSLRAPRFRLTMSG